jgi:hypothetical protein
MAQGMFNLLKVIHLDAAARAVDGLAEKLTSAGKLLPGTLASSVGKTLPRALNGGQLMWRLTFASEQDYRACVASRPWRESVVPALSADAGALIDSMLYAVDFADARHVRINNGIWRCLVMAMEPFARPDAVQQLKRDLLLMPQYVSTIRNWALGHVVSAEGQRPWGLVWEQEFDDVAGLEGEYMTHPIHWGVVDGWFDPECPQRIVDPLLIHAAFAIDRQVII